MNWLGQEILPGTVVYRGAREGNSSSYKVGVVESVKLGTARVAWKFCPGQRFRPSAVPGARHDTLRPTVARMESKGSPGIDSLVVLDDYHLVRLEQIATLADQWRDGELATEDYHGMVAAL